MINQDRLVETFIELIKIASPSGQEDGIANELVKRLEKMGAQVEIDQFGNVIGKLAGKGKPFMLNAHMDTVSPGEQIKPNIAGDKITSDGTTVLGGDPKAGVAAILEAITSLQEDNHSYQALEIVFTRGEEVGLLGSQNLDYSKLAARQGITLDGEEGVEHIDLSAPGYYEVNATITGRGAHAGAEPEKGISAIKIGSDIINQLPLGRIDNETTANIGLIQGGSARNAVPETLVINGEIRSRSQKKLDAIAQQFKAIFTDTMTQYPGATLNLSIELQFGPYRFSPDHSVIKKIETVFQKMGISPHFQDSGGGTDVNIFHTHGIEAVVVGTGDYEAHTTREYVLIPELVQTAEFCQELIKVTD